MARTITILHVPDCPNVALTCERLADALDRLGPPTFEVVTAEVADPDDAVRRGLHGSPALLVDGVDLFPRPGDPPAFACRTYCTENGVEGAPSVDQIVAALAAQRDR